MAIEVPSGDPARAWLPAASPEVVTAWSAVRGAADADVPEMGLTAGERPGADVEVLASAVGSCEYLLAARMHAATAAGCLPLGQRGGMLTARGWSGITARRLARCGQLAADHPGITTAWAAGRITAEHVDPIARTADRFTPDELAAVVAELGPHWGTWSPAAITRFVAAADRMLHPPPDPSPQEADAYQTRTLSFALTRDTVILTGELPRLEGELVIAAIDALAERVRSTADPVPAGARRADALVQLVNHAHATGTLPSRGGLPVALTVTLDHTHLGDPVWRTSRGHLLTPAETRWAACDAAITPILVTTPDCPTPTTQAWANTIEPAGADANGENPGGRAAAPAAAADPPRGEGTATEDASGGNTSGGSGATAGPIGPIGAISPAARIAALAALMFDTRIPLAVGRTQRTATPAQRRALAIRDHGCIVPGCSIPADACQTHHLTNWAAGGQTNLSEMVLLCWAHHRQVDATMWTIHPHHPTTSPPPQPEPGAPPGTPWPANNAAPFTIRRVPRNQWRL